MNKSRVTCWKIEGYNQNLKKWEDHLISYPEDNSGFDLITCLSCGQVYSASVTNQVYFGPALEELINHIHCIQCGKELKNNVAPYPETFIGEDMSMGHIDRPQNIPADENSIIVEFPELYAKTDHGRGV